MARHEEESEHSSDGELIEGYFVCGFPRDIVQAQGFEERVREAIGADEEGPDFHPLTEFNCATMTLIWPGGRAVSLQREKLFSTKIFSLLF